MKNINKFYACFSILLAVLVLSGNVFGQEKERARLYLRYEKSANNDKKLVASLSAGRGKTLVRIKDAEIYLAMSAGDSTVDLATVATDKSGTAVLIIKNGYQFIKDDDGFTVFSASYRGNDEYRKSGAEVSVKDIQLELNASLVDSVKTVSLFAYETDKEGNKIPAEGLDIIVGVQRLYSVLQVGTVQTDTGGKGSIDFPDNIPGDADGMLTLVAKIDDNEFYGTVNSRKSIKWGTIVSYAVKPASRQLWTDEAPLWMIFSVFIVILAAWFHYILALVRVFRIKKAGMDETAPVN